MVKSVEGERSGEVVVVVGVAALLSLLAMFVVVDVMLVVEAAIAVVAMMDRRVVAAVSKFCAQLKKQPTAGFTHFIGDSHDSR